MKSWFLTLVVGMGLSGASPAKDEPFPNLAPTTLVLTVRVFMGTSTSVELKDGLLVFLVHKSAYGPDNTVEKKISVHPGKEAWARFIKEINAAKLYQWSKDYPNPGVNDGMQWSVDMVIDDRKFHSEGDNNYPVDGDEAKPTNSPQGSPAFDLLRQAVGHLMGQEFR